MNSQEIEALKNRGVISRQAKISKRTYGCLFGRQGMALSAFCASKIKKCRPAANFRRPPKPVKEATGLEISLFNNLVEQRATREKTVILLVEDDDATLYITRHALGRMRKPFRPPCCGCVLLYALHAPDIVFLDIGLPDGDGRKALTDIRQSIHRLSSSC